MAYGIHEKWERGRILGRWPEYVNFTKVIFRGCIQTESKGIFLDAGIF